MPLPTNNTWHAASKKVLLARIFCSTGHSGLSMRWCGVQNWPIRVCARDWMYAVLPKIWLLPCDTAAHSCCSQRYAALGQCPDQLGQPSSWPLHCSPARPRVGHCCVTPIRQPQRLQPLRNRYQHLTLSTIKHHQIPDIATDVCSSLGCRLSQQTSWITESDNIPSVPGKRAHPSQHGDLVGR